MKAVKTFVKTCYSEALISTSSNVADNEREDGSLISEETDGNVREHLYHGGLGLRFKFPGDPKKYVFHLYTGCFITNLSLIRLREASKIKLWTAYLQSTDPLAIATLV